jgi:hypothetical protein
MGAKVSGAGGDIVTVEGVERLSGAGTGSCPTASRPAPSWSPRP